LAKGSLIAGYAEAVLSVADAEGAQGKVEDELFAFARAMESNGELREALTDAALPAENRKAVVRELLHDRAHPVTMNLIGFLVESGHARDLGAIADAVAELAAERRRHEVAEVRTAVDLSADQRQRIAAALAQATGHDIEIKVIVDPTVVGGLVARVGDEVFDGSLASRLTNAKQQLGS
jgi:F-type H+-transporting ATPase subunit delta